MKYLFIITGLLYLTGILTGAFTYKQPDPVFTPLPQNNQTASLSAQEQHIINEINTYRLKHNLPSVSPSLETCEMALLRLVEIKTDWSHNGFKLRAKNKNLYKSYLYATENLARNMGYTDVVEAWINSKTHEEMLRGNTPDLCVKTDGTYYAMEGKR